MQIIEYFACDSREYWLEKIKKSDWSAGQYLHGLLQTGELKTLCGENTRVLLLINGDKLISFCTYAEQDDVRDLSLTPWVGFVYTFPAFRKKRCMGKLLEYAYALAKSQGHPYIYISTGEIGLYEKYGYNFWRMMKGKNGSDCRVYRCEVVTKDYSNIIGTEVRGTIDRPLGSSHPRHPEMIYPINYGYVDGVIGGDGA